MSRPAGQAHSINKALNDAQVKRLLDIAGAGPTGLRNLGLVWLCLSGCRIGEACSVRFSDLLNVEGEVLSSFVLNRGATKGKKTREVFLGTKARAAVHAYIASLSSYQADDRVFPLNSSYAATLVKRLMSKSGLDYRYSSHSLRKSFCSKAVSQKINITYIQRCMGHTSLATTNRYIQVHCEKSEKEILNLW